MAGAGEGVQLGGLFNLKREGSQMEGKMKLKLRFTS
jgi:hypothetical protein